MHTEANSANVDARDVEYDSLDDEGNRFDFAVIIFATKDDVSYELASTAEIHHYFSLIESYVRKFCETGSMGTGFSLV